MSLIQDLRHSLRSLSRSPGFTATAVLTLAVGMGATTAMYSVIQAVLLNSLPLADPARLYIVRESTKGGPMSVAWPNFQDWRAQQHSFESLAAYSGKGFQFFDGVRTTPTGGLEVSANFFSVARAHPLLGRFFTESEDKPGAPAVAVLGYRFWQGELHGAPKIIGSAINLNGRLYTVIGVTPPEFHFWLSRPEGIYVPIGPRAADPSFNNRTAHGSMQVLARPLPGVAESAARRELEGIAARLAAQYPATNGEHSVRMYRVDEWYLKDIAPVLWLLMAAVAIVLLVGCANVSNLLLTRGADREREYAIRSALGASAYHIFQQSVIESLWLALMAGVCGVLIAYLSLPILVQLGPASIPRLGETAIRWPVLAFSFAVTFVVALVCGAFPGWATLQIAPEQALRSYSSSSQAGRGRQLLRSSLLVAGVAVTVILSAATGLMLQSLRRTLAADPGFRPDHLLALDVVLTSEQYHAPAASLALFTSAEDKLRALPGEVDIGAVCAAPLQNECGDYWYSIPGRTDPNDANLPEAYMNITDENYFRAAGIRLISGRVFLPSDNASSPHVAVINDSFAHKWWPAGDAVGHVVRFGGRGEKGDLLDIVGVVDDVKQQSGLDADVDPEIFFPQKQHQSNRMTLLIRTTGSPESMAVAAENAVQNIDRQATITIHPVSYYFAQSLRQRQFLTLLLSIFAGLAIFLAAMGVFGVAAYAVASRRAEIAVRIALGAQPQLVKRWISLQIVRRVALGCAFGVTGSLLSVRLLQGLLYHVSPTDPVVLGFTSVLLIAVALLATWIPAQRAADIDPMQTLRAE
ncbi:MAG TPA: ABC transporter permease [Terriglobales bacterium]|nr:ABC transporter permease [Terriglobales bacterium]